MNKQPIFQVTNTQVLVDAFHVRTFVGVPKEERAALQDIEVTLAITLQNPVVATDEMFASVDYREIMSHVRLLAREKRRKLIETFAEEIAALAFCDARVNALDVTVRKIRKFPDCEAVGVKRSFTRVEASSC